MEDGQDRKKLQYGRNIEVGADAESIEELCLLACSSWLVKPSFLQKQGQQPRDGTTRNGLGSFLSITN